MYAARLIIVVFLILAVLVAYNPQAREKVSQTWDNIQPVVVDVMDNVYAAVRNLVAGSDSNNHTNDPGFPGPNFDRIVTMSNGVSL
jgi:hypothetical protein